MVPGFDIRLRSIGFLPWNERLKPVIGAPGPAEGAGAIEVPGRNRLPVRTRLEPVVGPNGMIGRVVDPDGNPRPLAVLLIDGVTSYVETEPPLALVPGWDGFWAMDRDGLSAVTPVGEVRDRVAVAGIRALPGPDGGVWVLGFERCWYVTDSGAVTEMAAPWRDPFDVCPDGDALTGWDPDRPGGVVRLETSGDLARRDLGVNGALFERPLRFGDRELWSAALRTLVHRDRVGDRRVTLTGAGITGDGAPYFAGRIDDHTWLFRADSSPGKLSLADGEQVLAVSGDRILSWSGRLARWSGADGSSAYTESETCADDVVEHGWASTAAYPFTAGPDGEVAVAASGPKGMVVLGLTWPLSPAGPP